MVSRKQKYCTCSQQEVSLCHDSARKHCPYYIHTLQSFHTKMTVTLSDVHLTLLYKAFLNRARTVDFVHCGRVRRWPSRSQYRQGEMKTVTNYSFNVHIACECGTKREQKKIQTYPSMSPRADTQSLHISTLKKHSDTSVIVALTFSLSHAVQILLTSKHLSLITPLLLSSPSLSLSGCLYLSSHPPWCFSPSLQSMWLLRCLSICSPRQAQRAGATL